MDADEKRWIKSIPFYADLCKYITVAPYKFELYKGNRYLGTEVNLTQDYITVENDKVLRNAYVEKIQTESSQSRTDYRFELIKL